MSKRPLKIIAGGLAGLLIFLILLAIANLVGFNNANYLDSINFLNSQIIVIILFSVLLTLGELFFAFKFPFNFPAPIFNVFGGVILTGFIFDVIIRGLEFASINISFVLRILEIVTIVIVILAALIVGYVKVFSSVGGKKKPKSKEKKEHPEWEHFKEDVKDAFHDAGKNIKKAIDSDEKKPKSGSTKSKSVSTQSAKLKKPSKKKVAKKKAKKK